MPRHFFAGWLAVADYILHKRRALATPLAGWLAGWLAVAYYLLKPKGLPTTLVAGLPYPIKSSNCPVHHTIPKTMTPTVNTPPITSTISNRLNIIITLCERIKSPLP